MGFLKAMLRAMLRKVGRFLLSGVEARLEAALFLNAALLSRDNVERFRRLSLGETFGESRAESFGESPAKSRAPSSTQAPLTGVGGGETINQYEKLNQAVILN